MASSISRMNYLIIMVLAGFSLSSVAATPVYFPDPLICSPGLTANDLNCIDPDGKTLPPDAKVTPRQVVDLQHFFFASAYENDDGSLEIIYKGVDPGATFVVILPHAQLVDSPNAQPITICKGAAKQCPIERTKKMGQ